MIYFIDFEASSLSDRSYPIEIGWIDEAGNGECHLIRPARGWTEWSAASERVHGISRETLEREGEDASAVALRAWEVLASDDAVIASDNPPFDQFWLGRLLAVPVRRPVPNLVDTTDLLLKETMVLSERIPKGLTSSDLWRRVRTVRDQASLIIGAAQEAHEKEHRHRALPDATKLWRIWCDVREAVRAELASGQPPGMR